MPRQYTNISVSLSGVNPELRIAEFNFDSVNEGEGGGKGAGQRGQGVGQQIKRKRGTALGTCFKMQPVDR